MSSAAAGARVSRQRSESARPVFRYDPVLLCAVLLLLMFALMASWTREDRPLLVPVAGGQNAPSLIAFLQRAGARPSAPGSGSRRCWWR